MSQLLTEYQLDLVNEYAEQIEKFEAASYEFTSSHIEVLLGKMIVEGVSYSAVQAIKALVFIMILEKRISGLVSCRFTIGYQSKVVEVSFKFWDGSFNIFTKFGVPGLTNHGVPVEIKDATDLIPLIKQSLEYRVQPTITNPTRMDYTLQVFRYIETFNLWNLVETWVVKI